MNIIRLTFITGRFRKEERQDEQTGHQTSVFEKEGKIPLRPFGQDTMNKKKPKSFDEEVPFTCVVSA